MTAKGCYAAVKAPAMGARFLTLAILNLSLALGLTASSWAEREFTPLRKSGPMVVSSVANLRPISLSAEMAAVFDGLVLSRHHDDFLKFWGPTQCGGVFQALACVVALVLLCQLRAGAGLNTFLAFADIVAAFDVASRSLC